jgi:hypothetical protein
VQAQELINQGNSWFTLLILFAIVLLALLKLMKPTQLFGYTVAFFTPGFFQKKAEEPLSIFTPFNFVLFGFTALVLSLLGYELLQIYAPNDFGFLLFLGLFSGVFGYLFLRYLLDIFLSNVLGIRELINYFAYVKYGYLFTFALWLLPLLILYEYGIKNTTLLLVLTSILLIFRGFLVLFNNKNILISKLFYFILYFCTLEIAPLLILYKTTTT